LIILYLIFFSKRKWKLWSNYYASKIKENEKFIHEFKKKLSKSKT